MNKIPDIINEIRNFTPRQVNYAGGEKTISFSQMQMYNECPHKWALNYRDGNYASSYSINLIFGTAIHEVIQHYLSIFYDKGWIEADRINLEDMFQEKFSSLYKQNYESNNKQHFSSPEEMEEFFNDGVEILNFIKKNKEEYFETQGWYLVGCEIPIVINPNKNYNNIVYKGYIDLVLYNENNNTFHIYDIKTATRSWSDKEKKDEVKQMQLVLYKDFFASQFNIPIENINVEFFILKRKIFEKSEYVQKRVQRFEPSSGKIKLAKTRNRLNSFIEECFGKDGTFLDKKHEIRPSKKCKYCPFNNRKELCPK